MSVGGVLTVRSTKGRSSELLRTARSNVPRERSAACCEQFTREKLDDVHESTALPAPKAIKKNRLTPYYSPHGCQELMAE